MELQPDGRPSRVAVRAAENGVVRHAIESKVIPQQRQQALHLPKRSVEELPKQRNDQEILLPHRPEAGALLPMSEREGVGQTPRSIAS